MSKWHSLTQKMRERDIKSDRWDDVDTIVRDYLEERALRLRGWLGQNVSVESILDLSPVDEPEKGD